MKRILSAVACIAYLSCFSQVGIGTTTPVHPLHVTSSTPVTGYFENKTVASGTGVAGASNNVTLTTLVNGSGGAFTGAGTGVFATATLLVGGTNQAIYSTNTALGTTVAVNAWNGTTNFKIIGNGSVSTIVRNTAGEKVVLYAPEAPEIYFQDFGQGELVNGRAHITLDPTYSKNVVINDKHPMRVFIQAEGDCKGTYVTNKTSGGFDVIELNGGSSNITFQWTITCNRADEQLDNGYTSKNADARFGPAPGNEKVVTGETITVLEKKDH